MEKPNNKDMQDSWELGGQTIVKVHKFRGTIHVDIREYYAEKKELKPSHRGIFLTEDQWAQFKEFADDIDKAMKKHK